MSAWRALQETNRICAIAALTEVISTRYKQDRRIFLETIQCLGLLDPGNSLAIDVLIKFLRDSQIDESVRQEAARILGEIGFGNSEAINALLEVLRTSFEDVLASLPPASDDEETIDDEIVPGTRRIDMRRGRVINIKESLNSIVAESLKRIDPDNPKPIEALIHLLERGCRITGVSDVVESLKQIGAGNPEAIRILTEWLRSSQNDYSSCLAAEGLIVVDPGNPEAIFTMINLLGKVEELDFQISIGECAAERLAEFGSGNLDLIDALIDLLHSSQDEETRQQAAYILGEVGAGSVAAIDALTDVLDASDNEDTLWRVAKSLGKIHPGNSDAIEVLIGQLHSNHCEPTRQRSAKSMGEISAGNSQAIAALIGLLHNSENREMHQCAVRSLGEIGVDNPKVTEALIDLLRNSQDKNTCEQAVKSLEKIAGNNLKVIDALTDLLVNSQDLDIRRTAAEILGKIDPGNPNAFNVLIRLVRTGKNWSLMKTLQRDQLPLVVSSLKDSLSNSECFDIIWHCAQNMTYPAFHKAWHNQPITSHPEVQDTTGVGSTAIAQDLNVANLPQVLGVAVANDPDLNNTIHLICINGSKFIDPDNPADNIYTQMIEGGCPKCDDGTPNTMRNLQTYWNSLKRDKRVVLVLYEDPGAPTVQEYSDRFLDALSKFGGAICVVSDQPHIPLQSFSPNQPNFIANLVGWIRRMVIENL